MTYQGRVEAGMGVVLVSLGPYRIELEPCQAQKLSQALSLVQAEMEIPHTFKVKKIITGEGHAKVQQGRLIEQEHDAS